MKKTFKWILFGTLFASLCALGTMLAIYLPQYISFANYSTKDGYGTFISYDDDTLEVVKNEEFGTAPYTLNVRLYNLSGKEQTLTCRFWFTCTDSEGKYSEYIDKEITIPATTNHLDSNRKYVTGLIDYSCELYEFSHCSDVKFGAYVKCGDLNIQGMYLASEKPETSIFIDDVLINLNGIRNENGFEVTSKFDLCEMLGNRTDKMHYIDKMWQKSFTGVIITLSCTGGIFLLCLGFTIILLVPSKKKNISTPPVNENVNDPLIQKPISPYFSNSIQHKGDK